MNKQTAVGVLVQCPHCKGVGQIELTGVYAETLDLLEKQGESSAADLSRLDGCKATAMNNRLAALEKHGLATSKRYGRKRLYEAT